MTMNISLPHWNGKKWVFKKSKSRKKSSRRKSTRVKPKPITAEQLGERHGALVCSLWSSQTNPSKVYIDGNRIHHGLVGLGLTLYGTLENDDYIKGFGKSLMKDDINDLPDWFNFKK